MGRSIFLFCLACALACGSPGEGQTQRSILAGAWYPADRASLAAMMSALLDSAGSAKPEFEPTLLVLPHAGYAYSGRVAAQGYALVRGMNPGIIVIIAPSHYGFFHGCSVMPLEHHETPLGRVRIAREAIVKLRKSTLFATDPAAHRQEHAVEIHLPFLQAIYGTRMEGAIRVLPILVGNIDRKAAGEAAAAIINAIQGTPRPLFIVSTDFTHYGSNFGYLPFMHTDTSVLKKKLRELDMGAIEFILKKDAEGFRRYCESTGVTICGRNPLVLAVSLFKNYEARLLDYRTSGDVTGDYANTVSYAAIAIHGELKKNAGTDSASEEPLTDEAKSFLLSLARQSIRARLFEGKGMYIDISRVPESCRRPSGAFVTLKINGRLRGCIGSVGAQKPLFRTVLENACNAAFEDPRFPPLSKNDFPHIHIEISVLTQPVPLSSPEDLVVGRDGLIVELGRSRGLLLPQVPLEWGWGREEFLIQTCRKAGLPDYAWKRGARLYAFQAIVFGETR